MCERRATDTLEPPDVCPSGWSPKPRPKTFEESFSSLSDDCMPTPGLDVSTPTQDTSGSRRKKRPCPSAEEEESASPDLKRGKTGAIKMKRTPQPTLTQSKLTSLLQPSNPSRSLDTTTDLDTSSTPLPSTATPVALKSAEAALAAPGIRQVQQGQALVTTDFLLKTLQMNTDQIIKAFTTNLGELAQKVEANSMCIHDQNCVLEKQGKDIAEQRDDIARISTRLERLEAGGEPRVPTVQIRRATHTEEYALARRSIRLWPVSGRTKEDLWGGVGDFIHGPLGVPECDVNQSDISEIKRVVEPPMNDSINNEVTVILRDKKIRDLLMVNSVNLAGMVDREGRPPAATRMVVPLELRDTFGLLQRFGASLRARHGPGTKRHVKFDVFSASLYINVKLPGDTAWTRVSPQLAREDLGASVREEDSRNQKRLAAKLVPGPRERLARPIDAERLWTGPGANSAAKGQRWRPPQTETAQL